MLNIFEEFIIICIGDIMILCFSGTGNSAYVAKRISDITNEKIISINEYIKQGKKYTASENERLIFVTPTYAWRIPRVVERFIESIKICGRHSAYFVMTCGGEIGNAEKYLKSLCEQTGIEFSGCVGIVMPENYIAMFEAPDENTALNIIEKAEPSIDRVAQHIKENKHFDKASVSLIDRIYSGIVNTAFYPMFVHAKKFYAKDSCIGCGLCSKLCPLNNITIVNGKPVWQDNCTHCMACICHCPTGAIEYSTKSKNQPRYTCPK